MKTLNKVISGLLIGGTIISGSAVAMASTTTAGKNTDFQGRTSIAGKMMSGKSIAGKMMSGKADKGIWKNDIEDSLKALVSAGVITQAESDKILALSKQEAEARQAEMDKVKNMTDSERKAYFESIKGQTTEKKGDIFSQAVSSGIITQEKADAAKAKLQETRETERKQKLTEGLSGLVTAGTITQTQADKVLAYVDTLEANKQASDKTSTTATKEEKKNPLSALVDNGTLTQEQLDAVSKVLSIGGGRGHGKLNADKPVKAAADTASSTVTE